jgi:hypothetical protein
MDRGVNRDAGGKIWGAGIRNEAAPHLPRKVARQTYLDLAVQNASRVLFSPLHPIPKLLPVAYPIGCALRDQDEGIDEPLLPPVIEDPAVEPIGND